MSEPGGAADRSDLPVSTIRSVLDQLDAAVLVLDSDGEVLDGNDTAVQRYGGPLQGATVATLGDASDQSDLTAAVQAAAQGKEQTVEWTVTNTADEPIVETVTFRPIHSDEEGSVVAIGRQIDTVPGTGRHQTEGTDRLAEKEPDFHRLDLEREYETVFNGVQDALFLLDVDEDGTIRFLRFNEQEERVTGQTTEEIRGKTPTEVFGEELGEELRSNYQTCVDRGEPVSYEEALTFDDRETVWQTRLAPIVIDGTVERIVGSAHEITELKEREQQLRRTQRRMELALETTRSAIYESEPATDEVWTYPSPNPVFGGDISSVDEIRSMLHPDDRDAFETAARPDAVGERYDLEYRIRTDSDTIRWVHDHGQRIRDVDGELRDVGVVTDVTERKQQKRELEQAKERLQVLFEAAPDAVVVHDEAGNVIDVNEQAVTNLGYTREELTAMSVEEFEVGIDVPELHKLWQQMGYGERSKQRGEHRRADGSTFPIEAWVNKVRIDGEPRFIAMIRDISAQVEREQRLERRNAFLQNTSDIITVMDDTGVVQYQNHRMGQLAEPTAHNIVGESPLDYVHPDDVEKATEAIESVRGEDGKAERNEVRLTVPGGGYRWYENRVVNLLSDPVVDGIIISSRDITERREQETAVAAARAELRQIIDLVPDLIFAKNRDGEYLLANEATAKAYGMTPEEVEGRPEHEVIPDVEDSNQFRQDDIEVIDSGTQKEIPVEELTTVDGERKLLRTTKIPYEVTGSGEDAVLGYARDVTALKEYEQTLERQRDNLRVLNQVVRHDIRNELQVILAYAETLDEFIEPDGKAYLEQLHEAGHNAVDITQSAREVTEALLQEGAEREAVAIDKTVQRVIDAVRNSYQNALVTVEPPIASVDVLADDMLDSVFRNLLSNAVIHNDQAVPKVTVTTATDGETVLIRVIDNGPGISDDRKERVFEEGEMSLDSGGTGLGLYLVQTLIDRYSGDVWIEDADTGGSEFVVELPIANA